MQETLKIKPYARLLTMLGDQLIKNEIIALVELIKNSYDADADWVKISFESFGDNYEIMPDSKIIIEDNGCGMTYNVIKDYWMNPAAPNKLSKKGEVQITPKKERIIQGEKGIGRYAMLKLGREIKIITRPDNSKDEYIINFNLSKYDDDFLTINGKEKNLFLEDISIELSTQKATIIVDKAIKIEHKKFFERKSGTRIEITNLKGSWSESKIEKVNNDLIKIESVFSKIFDKEDKTSLKIGFDFNGKNAIESEENINNLYKLLDEKAVIKITDGLFDDKINAFRFKINDKNKIINLDDPQIKGIQQFNDKFYHKGTKIYRYPNFGNFKFNFFIFDMTGKAPAKFKLDRKDKNVLKDHRIYLYRDGIRVYPYGNGDDDWLRIDMLRGTSSLGNFFSNDQVIGVVEISKKDNPKLKDKTNREGLIEEENATDDFISIIQTFLSYIRLHPFEQYRLSLEDKREISIYKEQQVNQDLNLIKDHFKNDPKAIALVNNVEKIYKIEKNYLEKRASTTEDLAGVGLSVETASHDIMLMLSKGLSSLDYLIKDCLNDILSKDELINELNKIRGMFSFVEAQMKDIQLLFTSSKQRAHNIKVKEILEKVIKIYKRSLSNYKITCEIKETGSPVVAKCTDAVLLQLCINLIDNSIYWLGVTHKDIKKIEILLDGKENKMIFSDTGPGIDKDDVPYIFEPFYSAKGEDGRGLGLYIARQLLERYDYSIELAELKLEKVLSGANFKISFLKSEE
jgi:signal transduction histidine kinase